MNAKTNPKPLQKIILDAELKHAYINTSEKSKMLQRETIYLITSSSYNFSGLPCQRISSFLI